MNKLLVFVLIIGTSYPLTAQEEPLEVVNQLLDSWKSADFERGASTLHEKFQLLSLHPDDPSLVVGKSTRDELLGHMKRLKPGDWEVRLIAPRVTISPTGIATVWSDYQFYIGGKLHHCGVELFQLYHVKGGWKIAHFADTHGPCGN